MAIGFENCLNYSLTLRNITFFTQFGSYLWKKLIRGPIFETS